MIPAPMPQHRPRPGRRHKTAAMTGGQKLFALCWCAFCLVLIAAMVIP